ncbi:MAG TPA: hypothetical protein VLW26_07965 [Steroidobacteraceae bacterium]|nr:hypothetical protein [Steroidobacteraceae bacterium]
MWWSTRKDTWPPQSSSAPTEQRVTPGTARLTRADSFYEGHENWHRAASPSHVRRNHLTRF